MSALNPKAARKAGQKPAQNPAPAAQVAQAQKAAAAKAGAPAALAPPALAPQEWGLCYQALNALFRGGVDGAPAAVGILNTMAKIEPYLKAAQEGAEG